MTIAVNDLIVHPGPEQSGRLIRVSRIEAAPLTNGTETAEVDGSQCHGNTVVFVRRASVAPAPIEELRIATADEISDAMRLDLLPAQIDGPSGDGRVRNPYQGNNAKDVQ
jgi:hypothetical protein